MLQKEDWHLTEGLTHEFGRGDPFAAAIRGTRMPMVITDPRRADNPIIFANEAFQKLTGYEREEIIGRNCRFLQGADTDPAAVKRLGQAIAASEPINIDIQNYRKDGSAFWNALYVSPVRAADGEVQFFFASQLNVSERYEAQALIRREKELVDELVRARTADLQAALEAKTTLLHEVDHRVKNNLTMIGSLLRLQARSIPDKAVRATLENMLTRVDALATVHRKLYQSDDVSSFDLSAFSESLIADVIGSSGRADIRLETQIGPASVSAKKAASVGLILNEIATNAIKHAYANGRSGIIRLTCGTQSGAAVLELADDGCGFDPAQRSTDSIGRTLIERLSRQIGATVAWRRGERGMVVALTIPDAGAG